MTSDSLAELAERIRHLARVPVLLVACDYDGTVAPLSADPLRAPPERESVTAMRTLAESAQTHVAVISGRSLRDLATLSRLPEEIRLVGSHGSEFDLGFAAQLEPDLLERRRAVTDAVVDVGRRFGAFVEQKPTGATLHFRGMASEVAAVARDELVRGPAGWPGITVRNGHDIMELSVVETSKGRALQTIRRQVGASAVLFLGDDVTDEDAFATLAGPDVGVKVGSGQTRAGYRVADTRVVAQILALLSELRADWLRGAGLVPIETHSVLSDLRTAAVVAPDARISWLCVPRVDSAAVFAELVGGPSAGYFSVRDDAGSVVSQRYRPHSLVLETRMPRLTVTDYLDVSGGRPGHLAGRSDLVRVLSGTGRARIEFAPRLDFGRVPTRLHASEDGIVVLGTPDLLALRAPGVTWSIERNGAHETAIGWVDVDGGELALELRVGTASLEPHAGSEVERRDETDRWWSAWSSKLTLPALAADVVERSALALKSLCHGPTGAVLSAATTGLPQDLGGVRNWDLRYCWLRDGALSVAALVRLGSHSEALAFLDWLLRVLESRSVPDRLAPLYNVAGRHLAPEADITDLAGYGGSRPVRVGNAAEGQLQLDVFGPVVELVHLLCQRGVAPSAEHARLVGSMALAVSRRWQEPDHGLWQVRTPPRHHVHSKVMCWLAADRTVSMADRLGIRDVARWAQLRDTIAAEVLDRGWNPRRGAFCAAYGSDDLDASVLAVGLYGLLPADDERFVSTVAAVESELRVGACVHRSHRDDGLPGREGGSNPMTSWLIDALAITGRQDEALALFDQLCRRVGPTGTMAEESEPASARALGNIPHAPSHAGLISNALRLQG